MHGCTCTCVWSKWIFTSVADLVFSATKNITIRYLQMWTPLFQSNDHVTNMLTNSGVAKTKRADSSCTLLAVQVCTLSLMHTTDFLPQRLIFLLLLLLLLNLLLLLLLLILTDNTLQLEATLKFGDWATSQWAHCHCKTLTRFNKIAIPNYKVQMASEQGSHWLIESPTLVSPMYQISVNCIFKRIHTTSISTIIWQFIPFIYHPMWEWVLSHVQHTLFLS